MSRVQKGRVTLVGAGPGDPGLLTLRGLEAIRRADVVVFDRLVGPELLARVPRRARQVAAESLGAHGDRRQRAVNRILIEEARRGHDVVRLKGGDPFVFGRGREEVEALEDAGIPCEVVPGVTSAIAGPEAAGIPVTHRGLASHVTIATGHESVGKATSIPWERLARVGGTLVILMCSDRIEGLTQRLRRGGLPADTPAAVVGRASWPDQEVRTGSLGTIARIVREAPVQPPALLVVGEVAALARSKRRVLPRPARLARRPEA